MATGASADYDSQIAEVWAKDLYAQAENMTFWHQFEGAPGSPMPIVRRDELEGKGAGDTIRVDIALALTGAGLTGDGGGSILEGNEERLKFRQSSITIEQFQHAVRWTDLAQALITHDMRSTALNQLKKWLAGKLDTRVWDELTGNTNAKSSVTTIPTNNKWFAGTATTRDTIADTNAGGRLTLDSITEIKAYAQTELKIEPLKTDDGVEWYGLATHPYAIMQLKRDDTKWSQAQREAQARGADNPVFTGAAGVWDGVILYSSNRCPRSNNSGSVAVADGVFFGAQALSRGYGFYPKWTEEMFSYGQEAGIATRVLVGEKLNTFDLTAAGGATDANKTAIGSMVMYAAAVAPTA